MVNGHIRIPRRLIRSLPSAPLVVRRRNFNVVPRPLPSLLDRGAQADARGATHVFDCETQAIARGAARCALQVLDRGAQALARGAARCLLQLLDRGAQDVSRGAARCLSQVLDIGARLLPAAPLAVCRRYLITVPGRCPRRRDAVAAG